MNSKKSVKELIIAHLDHELKGDELKELTTWLSASKANARYYAKIKDIWEASLVNASQITETDREWSRFISLVGVREKAIISRYKTDLKLLRHFAAVLIVGLIAGSLWIIFGTKSDPVFITSIVPKGSVTQLVLADSTIVYLNAGSELRYSPETKQKKREVYLKGEAWFDVVKNKRPFVVHTAFYDVNVTGTRFNVKAYDTDNTVATTLEEGQVLISSSDKYRLKKCIILRPGEQATLDWSDHKIVVSEVDTKYFTSWKNNKLMFLNMNFGELILLLERKYGVDIEVDDPGILKCHYSGTIKNETILEILEIIKHTLPIRYRIENQTVKIFKIRKEK